MIALVLPVAFALAVILAAVAGPLLLRRSAPLLVRAPRIAIAVLAGAVLLWPAAMLSIGPLTAWLLAGPTILPGGAAEVCQRCISAANPFGEAFGSGPVPTILLLALPAATALIIAAAVLLQLRWRKKDVRVTAARLCGTHKEIAGYEVTVVADDRMLAFSLPRSRGGIILSTGTIAQLDQAELAAVLAHEHAHVSQRHHQILAVVHSVAAVLSFVPLLRDIGRVLPGYLEIAADRAAQKSAGTTAVVSALLILGERSSDREGALHMAGPERVRQLVAPARGTAGALSAAAMMSMVAVLAGLTALVLAPYSAALAAGCV